MHGCGNDYIYVNMMQHKIENPQSAALAWSDRHKGIGSDGLVLIDRSPIPEADFSMRIFNADGSEAMMCGNASRCIGKYLYERELTEKTEIRLLTMSGVKILKLNNLADNSPKEESRSSRSVQSITVDMGEPIMDDPSLFDPCLTEDLSEQLSDLKGFVGARFVSMGNPHFVIFTDDVDRVGEIGPKLEHHPAFPQRCNIELSRIESDGTIRTRVWERGSGITMACGTGACATSVASFLIGKTGRKSQIIMDGGTLTIEWCEADGHVYKTGPAEFVFDGEIEL